MWTKKALLDECVICRKDFQKLAGAFCIVPQLLHSRQLIDCMQQANLANVKTAPSASKQVWHPGTKPVSLGFEAFVDALGRCALVAYLTSPPVAAAKRGVVLTGNYSTKAKDMWLTALLVSSLLCLVDLDHSLCLACL